MNIKAILIGTVVLCLVMFCSLNYIGGLSSSYNKPLDTKGYFNNSQARLDNLTKQSNETYNELLDVSLTETNFLFASMDFLKVGWASTKQMFSSVGIFFALIGDTASAMNAELSVPPIVWGAIITIIIFGIIIMLIQMFVKWNLIS